VKGNDKVDTNRILSSLCYFSIFFAGFILPIAVYFITDSKEVKEHAKYALISHIIPLLSFILFLLVFVFPSVETQLFVAVFVFVIFGVINVGVIIWNVVKGIKVLRD
jgi:cytochrome bd-type quinol oxidase subunit 2